ncbi:phage tail sheath family protein [Paenibacillus spongiae]|uniref:Phage tail sheath subtilisin-like domain-containing protein n=1 Tax=Paenibacillus spongiae TaxID=2909671 RepID=A0ABY5S0K8_9BACL|nr:phage tail sheath subtilisin-like domain-containing protein [Paenibacillus spongiae]UVI27377.1 phage tail sheath subtilisin-like domain-containing protein [Paenibacillus spongiae]
MPQYFAPGVYVEEIELGGKPVEGVSTSTAGFLGQTERGPTTPRLITSWLQFQRVYGGVLGEQPYLPHTVKGFFDNGGKRCYIARITKASAVSADRKLKDAADQNGLTVQAIGEGAWGNRIAVSVTKGSLSGIKINVYYWKDAVPDSSALAPTIADTKKLPQPTITESFDNVSADASSPDFYAIKVNGVSAFIELKSKSGDTGALPADGKNAVGYLTGGLDSREDEGKPQIVDAANKTIKLAQATASTEANAYVNMTLEIVEGTGKDKKYTITAYDKATITATIDRAWDTVPDLNSTYRITSTKLVVEDFVRGKTTKPDKKGLFAFADIDDISILHAPYSEVIPGLTTELITQCENLRDRVVIIDSKKGEANVTNVNPRADHYDSMFAAYYYPWVKIVHPTSGMKIEVPPGGHVAGIYARSDAERGVHKAPANEIVRGAVDLEFQITMQEQETLNPLGVNVIRSFPGRGIRVWGARTTSSNPSWKYINVRRLFNFIEESIDEGTQWVVFEPNDAKLWARVRRTINDFLTRVWRDGALMGTKQEEAFFVRVDDTTMTKEDIQNGRLIAIIGIAPVNPAEFVIFRIAQVSSGTDINQAY